jgi:TolB-like protein/Flp pilus assembly protein TadD
MSLFSELKRRNVIRVAIAYLALAWLLTEVAGTLFPAFGVPDWAFRFVVIVLVLGFVASVVFSWAFEITPEGLKRESEVVRTDSITHITAKRLDGITIGLIVMAVAFIAVDRIWLGPGMAEPGESKPVAEEPARTAGAEGAEPQFRPQSIAVLPFVNMSEDPANEYFSDGISEELLNLLAKIPELRVISRSSAFSFKGKDMKMEEIARELDVAHILEGSVRKADNRVRITAQLIDTRSDTHLWSETYDRTLDDVFAIQDEIAATVVGELRIRLLGGELQTRKVAPEAYELFLQARYLINQGSGESLREAIEILNEAVDRDPSYAPAWSELHRAYSNQISGRQADREETASKALEAINRAIELDPDDAVSLSRLGWFQLRFQGRLNDAARLFERALALEPGNAIVLANAASMLQLLGRLEQTIRVAEWAVNRNPLDPTANYNLARVYFGSGRLDDAEATLRKTLQLSPDYGSASNLMARVLYNQGKLEEAGQYTDRAPSPIMRQLGEALFNHARNETAQVDAILKSMIDEHAALASPAIAFIYAVRGDNDDAFQWIDRAIEYYGPDVLMNLRLAPELDEFRKDPRYEETLARFGLAERQLAEIEFDVKLPE